MRLGGGRWGVGNRNYIQSSELKGVGGCTGFTAPHLPSVHPTSPLFFPRFRLHFPSPSPFFGGATLICRCIKYIIRGYNLRDNGESYKIRGSVRSQHLEFTGGSKVRETMGPWVGSGGKNDPENILKL